MNFVESYNNFLKTNFVGFKNRSEQDFLKAKILVATLSNLILLNTILIFICSDYESYWMLAVVNVVVWSGTFIALLSNVNLNVIFAILTLYGCVSISAHAYLGGGLYSSFNLWFPMIALGMSIFFNRVYSVFASIYSMLTISFFFYLQVNDITNFKEELKMVSETYDYINMMSIMIMLSFALYFFFSKENIDLIWKKEKESRIDNLETLLLERTAEIKKMRSEMAREFHDEMGNKLALISTYINVVQLQNLEGNSKLMDYLDKINQNAKAVYEGTRDFIWTIEAEHANFFELGVYIRDFGERVFLPVDIDFITNELAPELKNVNTAFTENHQIILIAKEAMTNALKHSNTKKIELKFEYLNDEFVDMYIIDFGVGFEKESLARVNGIKNMQKRANKINAELKVISDKSVGTTIFLRYKIRS